MLDALRPVLVLREALATTGSGEGELALEDFVELQLDEGEGQGDTGEGAGDALVTDELAEAGE